MLILFNKPRFHGPCLPLTATGKHLCVCVLSVGTFISVFTMHAPLNVNLPNLICSACCLFFSKLLSRALRHVLSQEVVVTFLPVCTETEVLLFLCGSSHPKHNTCARSCEFVASWQPSLCVSGGNRWCLERTVAASTRRLRARYIDQSDENTRSWTTR